MSIPLKARMVKKQEFCAAHGIISAQLENFLKRHPMDSESLCITEQFTNFEVTRFEIYPGIYNLEHIKSLIKKVMR